MPKAYTQDDYRRDVNLLFPTISKTTMQAYLNQDDDDHSLLKIVFKHCGAGDLTQGQDWGEMARYVVERLEGWDPAR